ncbi:hypothetical protein A6C59_03440 [Listeria monocytogenes]|nr:hypothetical protein [Listeria monocytogenes]
MKDKITNNATIHDLEVSIEGAKFLNDKSQLFGVKGNENLEKLEKKILELKDLPDKFNEIFSSEGWIAHDSMNCDVMKECVELGRDGESILMNYYEGELEGFINIISYRPVFKERSELLKLAKEDYFSGRYHSSIPIVLMLVDGIVNDIKPTGLFADNTDLDVWDSIAGHSTGLTSLVSILKKNRTKTNIEPINLPYRNGILHGRELNYNNKNVAIKTFAILFYLNDWMRSLESEPKRKQDYLEEKKREEETSLLEVFRQYSDHKKKLKTMDKLIAEWQPRKFEDSNQENLNYNEGTPEFSVITFLDCIKKRNFGTPVSFYLENLFGKVSVKEKAGLFRREYENVILDNYSIAKIDDKSAAVTHVYVSAVYKVDGVAENGELDFRMIYEKQGEIENRLVTGGDWKIVNIEGIIDQLKFPKVNNKDDDFEKKNKK